MPQSTTSSLAVHTDGPSKEKQYPSNKNRSRRFVTNNSTRLGLSAIEKHFGAEKEADHQRMSAMDRYNDSMSGSLTERLLRKPDEGDETACVDSHKEQMAAEIAKFESGWGKV